MKEKIIIFIIGVLVGAVLATGAFYIYTKINVSSSTNQSEHMPGGTPPEMNGEAPPEKPDGESGEGSGETPPEKPSNETNTKGKTKTNTTTKETK